MRIANQPIVFSVTGDVPYGSSEIAVFQTHIDDHDTYSPSKFIVHVGDILAGSEPCNESRYITVADILQTSELPAFIVPGDNETTDCSNPTQGWNFWQQHLSRLEENFCGTPPVDRQPTQDENFAFTLDGILFLGIHLVGGSNDNDIMQNDADWVAARFAADSSMVRGAVVFSQAGPGSERALFFDQFEAAAADFNKPILFIHGDGHSWKHDYPFSEPNVLRVQIERGTEPPVQVTAGLDVNDMFSCERDPFTGVPPVTRGPCGEPSYQLTVQLDGSGNVDLDPAGGTYLAGTIVALDALPDSAWAFQSWSGDLTGAANPDTVTMSSDLSVTAHFVVNTIPVAVRDSFEVEEDGTLVVAAPGVLQNDSDADGDSLTAVLGLAPGHGAVQLATDGSFTYAPSVDFHGIDAFTYTADDGRGGSASDSVVVVVTAVSDPPATGADSFVVAQGTLLGPPAPGVLQNDFDPDGEPLSIAGTSPPASGQLSWRSDGSFLYVPDAGFTGVDEFLYTATDGVLQSPATSVSITVTAPPSASPVLAPVADAYVLSTQPTTNFGSDATLVIEADSTVHHSYLRFDVPTGGTVQGAVLRLYVTNPSNDGGSVHSVANTFNGSPAPWTEAGIHWDNAPQITGPVLAFIGAVSVDTWVEFDVASAVTAPGIHCFGMQSASPNSVRYSSREGANPPELVVSTAPNASPVAAGDTYAVWRDDVLAVGAPGVLDNDADSDGDSISAILFDAPSNGELSLNGDGSFVYTPQSQYVGADWFRYVATDPANGAALATVQLQVRPPRAAQRARSEFETVGSGRVRWTSRHPTSSSVASVPLLVTLELRQPAAVELSVHDVLGRRVRQLVEGWQPPGRQEHAWLARNDQGRSVATGVYFVRLSVDGTIAARKVVLVR